MSTQEIFRVGTVAAAVGIVVAAVGWGVIWGSSRSHASELERRVGKLEVAIEDIGLMRKDVEWIRRELDRGM